MTVQNKIQEKIHKIELQVVEIKSDVKRMSERLDNGISMTLTKIHDKMTEEIIPAVKDSIFWISWIKKLLIIIIAGGLARLAWSMVEKWIK